MKPYDYRLFLQNLKKKFTNDETVEKAVEEFLASKDESIYDYRRTVHCFFVFVFSIRHNSVQIS